MLESDFEYKVISQITFQTQKLFQNGKFIKFGMLASSEGDFEPFDHLSFDLATVVCEMSKGTGFAVVVGTSAK